MKILNFILISVLLFSCKDYKEKESFAKDRFIEIYHLREGMHFPMALNCNSLTGDLLSKEVKYLKIADNDFMKKFEIEFKKLSNEDYQKNIDARIKILYHHDDLTDTICMGERFFVAVNGELKRDSPELLKIIQKETRK